MSAFLLMKETICFVVVTSLSLHWVFFGLNEWQWYLIGLYCF